MKLPNGIILLVSEYDFIHRRHSFDAMIVVKYTS